jgi:hypothetical protein
MVTAHELVLSRRPQGRIEYIDPRIISRYESDRRLPSIPVLPAELRVSALAEDAVAALLTSKP